VCAYNEYAEKKNANMEEVPDSPPVLALLGRREKISSDLEYT